MGDGRNGVRSDLSAELGRDGVLGQRERRSERDRTDVSVVGIVRAPAFDRDLYIRRMESGLWPAWMAAV
jgi:hypothetical protein